MFAESVCKLICMHGLCICSVSSMNKHLLLFHSKIVEASRVQAQDTSWRIIPSTKLRIKISKLEYFLV